MIKKKSIPATRTNPTASATTILVVLGLGLSLGLGATAAEHLLAEDAEKEDAEKNTLTIEEQRVGQACTTLPELRCGQTNVDPRFARIVSQFQNRPLTEDLARALGSTLWGLSQQTARGQTVDDRLLYWHRLKLKREIKSLTMQSTQSQAKLLDTFERASRGFGDLRFSAKADLKILVTGFDPFGLHNHLDQSNPSGVAALSLDGLIISNGAISAEIQSAVFPVRFADFDDGMVESVVQPLIANNENEAQTIDALFTISMGRSEFDLERFPGRRRSATAPDNLMVRTFASAASPLIPVLNGAPINGPEFVEFSLPVDAMIGVQTPFKVNDNRKVATLESGRFEAETLTELQPQTAVSGSGGGYLSNEISYRTVHLARGLDSPIAVGHIHTPRITGSDPALSGQITRQIRTMIEAALATLAASKAGAQN